MRQIGVLVLVVVAMMFGACAAKGGAGAEKCGAAVCDPGYVCAVRGELGSLCELPCDDVGQCETGSCCAPSNFGNQPSCQDNKDESAVCLCDSAADCKSAFTCEPYTNADGAATGFSRCL